MSQRSISLSVDLKDIQFALFDLFGIEDLLGCKRFSNLDGDQVRDILSQAEKMGREVIFPVNKVAYQTPPRYVDGRVIMPEAFHTAFRKYCDAGWLSVTLAKESGGLGLPECLAAVIKEIFNGASGGFFAFSSLTSSALNLLDSFGTELMKRLFRSKMAKGIFCGTMCLTEPEAGSFLADITTSAKREGDHFKIKGTKVFIGTGEHDLSENIVHCVLARIEGALSGYKGLSIFAVPKYRVNEDESIGPFNDVFCSGIERKMGHDGAPTAVLHFGDNDDCQGRLLGEEGQGLTHMFQMMNEMRLGTAAQAVGQAAAAYRMALSFAKERVQGLSYKVQKGDPLVQVPIIQHPDVRRNLLFMKAIVEGCRRLNILTGLYIDLSKSVNDPGKRKYYHNLVEILIPICKSYASDMGFRVAETAVQVMGGYGYIKDYHVEQYVRDIKPTSIYEGTNGIQAIDLTRRKLNLNEGRLFQNLTHEMDRFIDENILHPVLGPSIGEFKVVRDVMVDTATYFTSQGGEDPGLHLSVAKPFLDLMGHVLCTWMLLKSAVLANSRLESPERLDGDRSFYQGKILTARFAVSNFLPQAHALAKTVKERDSMILQMEEDCF